MVCGSLLGAQYSEYLAEYFCATGFPDSFLLWRHFLQSPELQRNHILVAVDLPGYGGSDSVRTYGPNEVLETLSEFIISIRTQFLQEGNKTVAITHDWGAIVGARLAAEASVLADHWIITSGLLPGLVASNAVNRLMLAKQMLRTWIRSPLNIRLLKNGLHALGPVAAQFRHSFYIFVFHLPWPLNNTFSTFGNYWFLRILHQLGKGPRSKTDKRITTLNPTEAAEAMAISTGPSLAELEGPTDVENSYSDSLWDRVHDRGMSEKIRIYREGLMFGKWEKSLETTVALYNISSSSSHSPTGGLSNTAPHGALKAPATIIMGERDPAFDQRLALDNARDYLVKGSQVLVVKGGGHW
jgi:pimeloyl-ACP methyl ester carboxylesterase